MEHDARRVLELIAVAGAPAAARRDRPRRSTYEPPRLTKLIGTLRATSLVRTGGTRRSIRSSRITTACARRSSRACRRSRRRRYHERLATVLLASPIADKDPLTIVRHLEAAGHIRHAGELAIRLRGAPRAALAFELAAALWEVALRLSSPMPTRAAICLMRRAAALSHAGSRPGVRWRHYLRPPRADARDRLPVPAPCRARAAVSADTSTRALALMKTVLARSARPFRARRARRSGSSCGAGCRSLCAAPDSRRSDAPDAARASTSSVSSMRSASLGLSMVDVLPGAAFQAKRGARSRCASATPPHRVRARFHAMYLASSGIRVPARRASSSRRHARSRSSSITRSCSAGPEPAKASPSSSPVTTTRARHPPGGRDADPRALGRHVGRAQPHSQLHAVRAAPDGRVRQLRDRTVEYVRDALRRGDRYAATSFVWSSNVCGWPPTISSEPAPSSHSVVWSRPEDGLAPPALVPRARASRARDVQGRSRRDRRRSCRRCAPFLGPAFAHVEAVTTETRFQLGRVAIRNGDAEVARREVATSSTARQPVHPRVGAARARRGRRDRGQARRCARAARSGRSPTPRAADGDARRTRAPPVRQLSGEPTRSPRQTTRCAPRIADPERFVRVFATWPERDDEQTLEVRNRRRHTSSLLRVAAHEVVDQLARDRQLRRDYRHSLGANHAAS